MTVTLVFYSSTLIFIYLEVFQTNEALKVDRNFFDLQVNRPLLFDFLFLDINIYAYKLFVISLHQASKAFVILRIRLLVYTVFLKFKSVY